MKYFLLLVLLVVVFLVSYFPVRFAISPVTQIASNISVIFMALPSLYGLIKVYGKKKAFRVFFLFGLFALLIENIAVLTGYPYGEFQYSELMGAKILAVPWTVSLAWLPILLGGFTLAILCTHRVWAVLVLTAVYMTLVDVVLDPGAVSLGFWSWRYPGSYYQIPLSNFFGWISSSLVAGTLLYSLSADQILRYKRFSDWFLINLLVILSFWTGVCFWQGLSLAWLVGAASCLYISLLNFSAQKNYE